MFTTDKGKDLREKVASRMTKEEIDKLIEKLKQKRATAPTEDESFVDDLIDEVDAEEMAE